MLRSHLLTFALMITVGSSLLDPAWAKSPSTQAKPDQRRIHKEWVIDAPRAVVWWAWTTAEGLKSFLAKEAIVELKVGGTYEFFAFLDRPEGERGNEGCTVLGFVPEMILSMTWNAPPGSDQDLRDSFAFVVLHFEDAGVSTRLTADHLGFPDGERWDKLIKFFDRGWEYQIEQLKGALEQNSWKDLRPGPPHSDSPAPAVLKN